MASPSMDPASLPPREDWAATTDGPDMREANGDRELDNVPPQERNVGNRRSQSPDYGHGSENGASVSGSKNEAREKQVKPNKIYIGGLPEHTRSEDLQHCFGKLGTITNIELKVGYGFVEFDSKQAADEAITKYDEGYFMGNKIRVEASHGGGRTAKFSNDPGACFRCGNLGHWARECPNQPNQQSGGHSRRDGPPFREPPFPPREYGSRDDYGRMPPYDRYRYDYPPPPGRDMRRPPSPPRDYRDYPGIPPRRDYDEFRRGPPLPPPGPPGMHRPDSRPPYYGPPEGDFLPGYPPPRGYGGPPPPGGSRGGYGGPPPPPLPPRDGFDRYDRRPPPPGDRYGPPYPHIGSRPRSPPPGMNGPPRPREDFDRPPPPQRDYPPPGDYRGRPGSPRYGDYPPRAGSTPDTRYRRRSASPRSASGTSAPPYDPNYSSNGYPGPPGNPAARPPIGSRDYPPRGGDAGFRRP